MITLHGHILVYDADCGPCQKFRQLVDWLDGYKRIAYVSLVGADESGLLNSIPQNRRHKSFHLISPEGRISSGAEAIPNLLQLLPLGGIAAGFLNAVPKGQSAVSFLYTTISRLHNTGSCSYESTSSFTSGKELDELSKKARKSRSPKLLFVFRMKHQEF